jgi:tetratricopeptide (TPR) repeat protein
LEQVSQQIELLEKKVRGGRSPLFARLAGLYLESGRVQDALRVCEEGLANYPFYATGHLIRGKALSVLKMNAEARREFTWVLDYLPGAASVKKLLDQVPPGDEEILLTFPPPSPKAKQEMGFIHHTAPASQHSPLSSAQPPSKTEPSFDIPAEPSAVEDFTAQTSANEFGVSAEPPAADPFSSQKLTAESPFGAEMTNEAPSATDFGGFGGLSETPPSVAASPFEPPATPADDPFGFGGMSSTPPEAATDPFGSQTAEPSTFGSFGEPSAEPTFTPEPTADPGFSFGPATSEEESFEAYAVRMRGELTGENSISLDEFLNPQSPLAQAEPEPSSPTIEELANTLQTAKKITPVINFATRATTTASESDTPASTGFVTPTLAEIYAKQGWFDDAIKAYKALANNKPADRERFMQRIAELEEQKKNAEA